MDRPGIFSEVVRDIHMTSAILDWDCFKDDSTVMTIKHAITYFFDELEIPGLVSHKKLIPYNQPNDILGSRPG